MDLSLSYLLSHRDFLSPVPSPFSELIKTDVLRTRSQICGDSMKWQKSQNLGTASRHPDACLSQSGGRKFTKDCRIVGRREENSRIFELE